MLESPAFWTLKVHSIRVLMIFMTKRVMKKYKDRKGNDAFRIENNGELVFTYEEAIRRGLDKKQYSAALDDLIAKGFLEITRQGTGPGEPSLYKLTERWQAWDTSHFEPGPPRRKNRHPGMGWNIYNQRRKQNPGG